MEAAARIVRRARLRGPDERALRRGATLLEDALRTASLPDPGGRVVLVRRLALGRIDPHASPQSVALALERAVAQRRAGIVYAGQDSPEASAVWFRDALDAHTRLALRLADGRPVDAWYWPLAVGAWRPGSPLPAALRAIALSLAALPEAPAALPRWVAALCAAGHRERLAAALQPDDLAVLARAARLRIAPSGTAHPPAGGQDAVASPPSLPPQPVSSRTGPTQTTVRADARQGALFRALLRTAGAPTRDALQASATTTPRDRRPDTPPTAPPLGASQRASTPPGERVAPPVRRGAHRALDATAATDPQESSVADRYAGDDAPTTAGGLLFLVPALVRVGFAEWLAAHPEWARYGLAPRVLGLALMQLAVAPEDPAWRLAAPTPRARSAPRRFVAPARWRDELTVGGGPPRLGAAGRAHALWDSSNRLLLGAWRGACPRPLLALRGGAAGNGARPPDDLVAGVTHAWLAAARRWLRRRAGIGLAALVARRATLALTPTHADVRFDLAHADLRVRRAGLDLDPGWVPWLGRVIAFHYER